VTQPTVTSVASLLRRAQRRMALLCFACVGLSMCGVGLHALRDYETRSMELVARSIAFAGEPALRFNDKQAMLELIEQVASAAQIAEVTIDSRGEPNWLRFERPKTGVEDRVARFIEGQLIRDAAATVIGEGTQLGRISLHSNGRTLLLFVQWAMAALLISALMMIVVIGTYSRRLAKSIVRPIEGLASLTRQVRESQSFKRRAGRAGVREIDALAGDFNAMLSELELQQSMIAAHHTDLREANETLKKLSQTDSLTELPNRAYLAEHLDEVIERCRIDKRQAGLIFIDTDRFKEVNDKFGHSAGDVLLVELSKRLRESIRDTDFVARIGGDEFVIVINPLSESNEISNLTDRIRINLDRRLALPGGELRSISVTMGVAIFPDHADHAAGLVKAADEAMYRAKSVGRGSVGTFRPVGDAGVNDMACPWISSS
jgi:diguanylate cyclase (GGDEF)-like protein